MRRLHHSSWKWDVDDAREQNKILRKIRKEWLIGLRWISVPWRKRSGFHASFFSFETGDGKRKATIVEG